MQTYQNINTGEKYQVYKDKKGKLFMQWLNGNIAKPERAFEISENWNNFNLFVSIK
jgi:hypothetical protein